MTALADMAGSLAAAGREVKARGAPASSLVHWRLDLAARSASPCTPMMRVAPLCTASARAPREQRVDFVSFMQMRASSGSETPGMVAMWMFRGTAIALHLAMRVLIVDESPDRTAVLREGLEGAGYEVAAA